MSSIDVRPAPGIDGTAQPDGCGFYHLVRSGPTLDSGRARGAVDDPAEATPPRR